MNFLRSLFSSTCLFAALCTAGATDLTAHWDTTKVIANPWKGWYHHHFDNGTGLYPLSDLDSPETFPGLDHLYLRLCWAYLEPEEGRFNWSLLDEEIEKYTALGYGISFRISCKESGGAPDFVPKEIDGVRYATPYWVVQSGAKGEGHPRYGGPNWTPDWDDPVFLEKLENFHKAFAARYDGAPWLRYVDIGSLGDWGEGHTSFCTKETLSVETILRHIGIYLKYYKKSRLVVTDDLIANAREQGREQELLDFVLSHGITLRDDSPLVQWYTDHNLDTWTVVHPDYFEKAYREYPVVFELEHYLNVKRNNLWHGRNGREILPGYGVSGATIFENALRTMHASYIGYHGYMHSWIADNPEFSGEMLNLCGYWYFPVSASVEKLKKRKIEFTLEWFNKGVAPAYKAYELRGRLVDVNNPGNVREFRIKDSGNRAWMPGSTTEQRYSASLRKLKPAEYRLEIALFDPESGRYVNIGLSDCLKQDNFYEIERVSTIPHATRIFMSESNLKALEKKIRRNADIRALDAALLNCADSCLRTNPDIQYKFDESGIRLLAQSRMAFKEISLCSYAWRRTSKPEYLARVIQDLETVCNFPDWNPSHYLDTGEMGLAVALGYDWCHDALPLSTRSLAERALREKILGTYSGSRFKTMTNNWNQVCWCGVVAAAVAMRYLEPALFEKVVSEAAENNRKVMDGMYAPDGIYPEGYMYWAYGTTFETMLLTLLEDATGSDSGLSDSPGFLDTGDFMLYMAGPAGKNFNFSDCREATTPLYALWWFAQKKHDTSLLFNEIRQLRECRYADYSNVNVRYAMFSACMAARINLEEDSLQAPDAKLWRGNGVNPVVLLRDGWNFDDSDSFLAVKGGKAAISHGHMDAGSFVFDSRGERWASDLGMQDYQTVENRLTDLGSSLWDMSRRSLRWKIFRLNNYAHNTLTVNGELHIPEGKAEITDIFDTDSLRGAVLDMTPVFGGMLESAKRIVCLVNGESLLVEDCIEAPGGKPAIVEWRMVTDAAATVLPEGIRLDLNGKSMLLSADCEGTKPDYRIWPASGESDWDAANPGKTIIGFVFAIPAGKPCKVATTLRAS